MKKEEKIIPELKESKATNNFPLVLIMQAAYFLPHDTFAVLNKACFNLTTSCLYWETRIKSSSPELIGSFRYEIDTLKRIYCIVYITTHFPICSQHYKIDRLTNEIKYIVNITLPTINALRQVYHTKVMSNPSLSAKYRLFQLANVGNFPLPEAKRYVEASNTGHNSRGF